ncbi:hypothetical protein P7C71_g4061, partial [Lecanoromycetidae sp. Uapishka_2]
MASNTKRKWRFSSKSLFGSQAPDKVIVLDNSAADTEDGPCESRTFNTPSKVPSERDVALAIARDAATSSSSTSSPRDAVRALKELDVSSGNSNFLLMVPATPSIRSPLGDADIKHVSIEDNRVPRSSLSPTHFNSGQFSTRRMEPSGLRHSSSNTGLAHQISHKLSSTFGYPTIVHRPNLRTRPALLVTHQDLPPEDAAQSDLEFSPQVSTAPSSFNFSGSVSTTEPSTDKTSLESNTASLRSAKAPDGAEKPPGAVQASIAEEITREKPLTPIQEAPMVTAPVVVKPTVATVETTANAKIFFETHFNSLLAGNATPRSIRKKDLEARLEASSMPEDQRQQERLAWAIYESEHLRQTRVLKGKTNEMAKGSGVAVAGYEVVRILGKGSFGVVRLVREKENVQNDPPPMSSTLPTVPIRSSSGRQDFNGPRMTTMEALRATLDNHKITQRRPPKSVSREVYAMKVIRKSDMIRNGQEGHLRAERDFLVASEKSRWMVPLVASFQDHTNLYLVMEYMVGGDFLGLLFRKDILKERHARWYIAEMILCVEEAHKLKWIHRDVKPDNFLISASGHLKISDFGLAFDGHWAHDQRYFKSHRQSLMEKLGIEVRGDAQDQEEDAKKDARTNIADILSGRRGRQEKGQVDGPSEQESILQWRNRYGKRRLAGSVVGTSQYMAPEVIRGDPYDGRCDWWSIGIILYECLYGFTPFVSEKREDTKAKILHSKRPPGRLVAKRSDPLSQDYQGNYVYPDDAEEIKAHRFFHRVAWERMHLSRPPFVPDVSGREDTRYFDEEEPISDVDDAASQSDAQEASDKEMIDIGRENARVTQVDGAQGQDEMDVDPVNGEQKDAAKKKKKEKKRPRDKVLRDKDVGKKVLEIRKQGGFAGYEYQRPKLATPEQEERGRQRTARRSLLPSFG